MSARFLPEVLNFSIEYANQQNVCCQEESKVDMSAILPSLISYLKKISPTLGPPLNYKQVRGKIDFMIIALAPNA